MSNIENLENKYLKPLPTVNKVNEIIDTLNDNLNMYYSEENPSLSPNNGICEWIVNHNLNTTNIDCSLFENGELIFSKVSILTENSIKISINSNNIIAPNIFKVIVLANGSGSSTGSNITNHAQLTNLDYTNSGHTGFLKQDASNLTSAGQKRFDGQWNPAYKEYYRDKIAPTTSDYVVSLNDYLPNDSYQYEVMIRSRAFNSGSVGATTIIAIMSDIFDNRLYLIDIQKQSSSIATVQGANQTIIPVGTGRKIYVKASSENSGSFNLQACGYRRIGTNT